MPYCRNCGHEVNENAFVCLNCGVLVDENEKKLKSQSNDGTSMGIIGLCFALFIPFVTWIVSGIGYSQSNQADNKNGKTMNLIALIASSVAAVIYFILSIS
jgi:uncharacterized membrane protein YvbJ